MTREMCQTVAADIGPATAEAIQAILADTAVDRLPTGRRLLRLREVFGDSRLEAACQRANLFGDPSYQTVKRILGNGLDEQAISRGKTTPEPAAHFVRQARDLLGQWVEDLRWN